jgi:hypothetical protein
MANGWSHAHGKTSPEVVPFTWQPTRKRHSAEDVVRKLRRADSQYHWHRMGGRHGLP